MLVLQVNFPERGQLLVLIVLEVHIGLPLRHPAMIVVPVHMPLQEKHNVLIVQQGFTKEGAVVTFLVNTLVVKVVRPVNIKMQINKPVVKVVRPVGIKIRM